MLALNWADTVPSLLNFYIALTQVTVFDQPFYTPKTSVKKVVTDSDFAPKKEK